jgi:hypothetical protein
MSLTPSISPGFIVGLAGSLLTLAPNHCLPMQRPPCNERDAVLAQQRPGLEQSVQDTSCPVMCLSRTGIQCHHQARQWWKHGRTMLGPCPPGMAASPMILMACCAASITNTCATLSQINGDPKFLGCPNREDVEPSARPEDTCHLGLHLSQPT